MTNPYIDASTLDECREARRQGRTLEYLAGQLQCEPEHLATLLGEPAWKSEPSFDDGFDLWSADRLDAVL